LNRFPKYNNNNNNNNNIIIIIIITITAVVGGAAAAKGCIGIFVLLLKYAFNLSLSKQLFASCWKQLLLCLF
jgi:hypothetical protein